MANGKSWLTPSQAPDLKRPTLAAMQEAPRPKGGAALPAFKEVRPISYWSMLWPVPASVSLCRGRPETAVSRHGNAVANGIFEHAFERNAERVDRQFLRGDGHAQETGIVLIIRFKLEREIAVLHR